MREFDIELDLGGDDLETVTVEITGAWGGTKGSFFEPPEPPEVEWDIGTDVELTWEQHHYIEEKCFEELAADQREVEEARAEAKYEAMKLGEE